MKGVGILLIVFGLLAGASSAASSAAAKAQDVPGEQRFFNALGGALCSLVLIVPGVYLVVSSGKPSGKYRARRGERAESVDERRPRSSAPVPPKPAAREIGADGKVALTCLACFTEVRAEVPSGATVVTCPQCEREIHVS